MADARDQLNMHPRFRTKSMFELITPSSSSRLYYFINTNIDQTAFLNHQQHFHKQQPPI
jgi:hypothetical protein